MRSETLTFISKLQTAQVDLSDNSFWNEYFDSAERESFSSVLDTYSRYYNQLEHKEQKDQLSQVFWSHIKTKALPIIEMSSDDKSAQVFFLFRKNIDENKKDLYVQGDYHGYGSTLESQRLKRKDNTDVMYCESTIPKDALVTYQYVEISSEYRDKMPPYFYKDSGYNSELTGLFSNPLRDPYQKHSKSYGSDGFFCVNAGNDISHLKLSPVNWPTLLSGAKISLVSVKGGRLDLHPAEVTPDYLSKLCSTPEYSEFRRVIHVFALEEKIDQVIIINDGMAYLLTNAVERIEKLKKDGKIPANCAVIFVGALPGLKKDHELVGASSKLSGMGERTLDYHAYVDEYAKFLTQQLFPFLEEKNIKIPRDPARRTLIGSSLSGTASLYMGLKYPEHFGNIVAQSPSPTNRDLIESMSNVKDKARKININLSCGEFEDSKQYAKNGNLEFMRTLTQLLGITGYEGRHGHQFEAWAFDLERSLPDLLTEKNGETNNVSMLKEPIVTTPALASSRSSSSSSRSDMSSSVSSLTTPGGPGLTSPLKTITPHTSKPVTTSTTSLISST